MDRKRELRKREKERCRERRREGEIYLKTIAQDRYYSEDRKKIMDEVYNKVQTQGTSY